MKTKNVLVGMRLPVDLVTELKNFCKAHCLRMNQFVSKIVQDRLIELKEEEEDIALFESRQNEPTFSEKEWNKILKQRGINV
ncbi:MAG: hypothetical protein J7L42_01860 [Elusimicrobia bacterium]|nr:hypothetical protein [Elusimicrobiota bacterium]